ncbi:MAG: hypothetical protein J7515_20420 [Caulobacter sp.]|nr:hypothetical protein [Caulobacter sp.]
MSDAVEISSSVPARPKISPALREAIWRAHGRLDAYTGDPLDWSELQIDHVVAVSSTAEDLAALVSRGIIPVGFDVHAVENLLPTKTFRNRQKSDRALDDRALHFFLDSSSKAAPKVRAYLADDEASDRSLDAFLRLRKEAERNDVSLEELLDLKRHQADGEVKVAHILAVEGGEGVSYASRHIAAELLTRPFSLGGVGIGEVCLQNDAGEKLICHNGDEFLAAKDAGFWALTQYDMNMYAWADSVSEFLRAVRDSRYAPNSRIRTPKVTFERLDRWSARWVIDNWNDPSEEAIKLARSCKTIADCVEAGLCDVKNVDRLEIDLNIAYGFSLRLSDLMRADLDGDDEEEVLIYQLHYAEEGTFRAGSVGVAKCDEAGLIQPPGEPSNWLVDR